jgi:hypothetical protein
LSLPFKFPRPKFCMQFSFLHTSKQTQWPQSASKLYRKSDRRLSSKLMPTFADRGPSMVGATEPYSRILDFLHRSRYFFFQVAPQLYSRG